MKKIFTAAFCAVLLSATGASAADVDVYAEGAYTADTVDVYIYADINSVNLKSFGVKLTYDPSVLAIVSATKNEGEWYMGDGVTNHPYKAPETTTAGEVVIIGGLLDTTAPLTGVSGARKLLGKINFSRLNTGMDFGIGLTLGKAGTYANFVTTDAIKLDETGVCFPGMSGCAKGNAIYARGDANGDGYITNTDMFAVKSIKATGDYIVFADCNADGFITNTDMFCIKNLK